MSISINIISHSPDETFDLGRELAARLDKNDCVALYGELGTGKTRFVQGICDYFQCAEQVTSPTFTIINEYHGEVKIEHCDLYRLENIDEIFESGLVDVLVNDSIVLIEWAYKAIKILPVPRWEVLLEHGEEENERLILIHRCERNEYSISLTQKHFIKP